MTRGFRIRALVSAAVLAATATPGWSQELPALFRVTDVAGNDVLNVRAEPDAGAELLNALAPDAVHVEVTELSADGRWGRVNMGERSGWASMRYLAAEPGPAWHELQTPLSCYGTEPFWSFDFQPAGAKIAFRTMEGAKLDFTADWVAPASGRNGVIGMRLSGQETTGFSVFRAVSCNDGMSDRVMGLAVEVFFSGPDGRRGYSGCCTLAP